MLRMRVVLLALAGVVTVVVTALALVACGGDQTPTSSPSASQPVVTGFVYAWGVHQPKNVLDSMAPT